MKNILSHILNADKKKIRRCTSYHRLFNKSHFASLTPHFVIDLICKIRVFIACKADNYHCGKMNRKYGDYLLENDEMRFIWGVKSFDDLSETGPNFYSMNDIEIIYLKKEKEYHLDIETIYLFEDKKAECNYLKNCLKAFEEFMNEKGLKKNEPLGLHAMGLFECCKAETLEELYFKFKIFVNGYCCTML